MNIDRLLSKAKSLQKKGDKTAAADIYRQVLTKFPKNVRAAQELQKLESGSIKASVEQALQHLIGLFQQQQFEQAILLGKRILQADSSNATAHFIVAATLASAGKEMDAVGHFKMVTKLEPNNAKAYLNLGTTYMRLKHLTQSIACYEKVITIDPTSALGYFNLSVALKDIGNVASAFEASQQAMKLDSNNPEIANNHSVQLILNNQFEEAEKLINEWITKTPNNYFLYANRARIKAKKGLLMDAEADLNKVKDLNAPLNSYVEVAATVLLDHKQYDESIALLEQAQRENNQKALTPLALNQCYNLNENTSKSRERTQLVANRLASEHQFKHPKIGNSLNPRLRIGYVSPDFNNHSVARFFEPLIHNHSDAVETYCYYTYPIHDDTTAKIKASANNWRDVSAITDDDLATLINNDQINILVDLAGHTGDNRLGVFSRKPAPVQVTWLGFPDTTGLDSIDYRFIDELTDPIGVDEDYYSESLYRLPNTFLSYLGDDAIEAADELPFHKNGYITFGSFNNLNKLTEEVIETWANILNRVANSKLLLKGGRLEHVEIQEIYFTLFEKYGLDRNRLQLVGYVKSTADHLKLYDNVDICLDCFPYNGATTTFEALWMGVPVVAYTGKRHAARVGHSIMTNLGYTDWLADNLTGYVDIAVSKAQNTESLSATRKSLRLDMKKSVLCDHKGFADNLEQAYLDIWNKWLGK